MGSSNASHQLDLISTWLLKLCSSELILKVAPYSFLTARKLVSKSRDGMSLKKSTHKSRTASASP